MIGTTKRICKTPLLVGGFNPSEKYSSIGMIIPSIWKVIKAMFQTTNQCLTFSILFLLAGFTDSPMAPWYQATGTSQANLLQPLWPARCSTRGRCLNSRPVATCLPTGDQT